MMVHRPPLEFTSTCTTLASRTVCVVIGLDVGNITRELSFSELSTTSIRLELKITLLATLSMQDGGQQSTGAPSPALQETCLRL